MYVRCDESPYSRINHVHSPDGNFSAECLEYQNDAHRFMRIRIVLCQCPGADTEETGRYDLAWKDLCSVLNALSNIMNYQRYSNIFYVHGYLQNLPESKPALARFSLHCWKCDFSWISTYHRRFIRCVFLENLTFTTFLSPFINTVPRFLTRCEYYRLDSKYNETLWRFSSNKTIHSPNLFALDRIFSKWQPEPLVKSLSMWYEGYGLHYRFYRFNLVWLSLCFVDDLCQILGMFSLTVLVA